MQMFRKILGITLAVLMCAPAALAQQTHAISQRALDQAVQQRVTQEQAERDAIRSFLRNAAVKNVAARAGLAIDKAEGAVGTLQGDELRQAADQARAVNEQLAGGDSVVLSTTTIIIIILLIILLIVALK